MFVPIPTIEDFEAFNQELFKKAEKDMNRKHYKKEVLISELFENDLNAMKKINAVEYNVSKILSAKADKYGKVSFDTNLYSTSPKFASKRVKLEVTYNKVIPMDEEYNAIITHDRIYDKNKESMQWLPYINLISRRPNALKYTGFYEDLPKNWQNYLDELPKEEKRDALLTLKKIIEDGDIEEASKSLDQALDNGVKDVDSILSSYYNLTQQVEKPIPLKLSDLKIQTPSLTVDTSEYDALLKGVM